VGSGFPENACRAEACRVPLRTARTTSKTSLQKLSQLRRRLELRNGAQSLEGRREGIPETPDRSRPEFLILGFEDKSCTVRARCFGASSLPSTNAS